MRVAFISYTCIAAVFWYVGLEGRTYREGSEMRGLTIREDVRRERGRK